MLSTEVKKGALVKMGSGLGIILLNEIKFLRYNHYAWVYYFDTTYHEHNPSWVFIENLKCLSKE